jgi:hypothetical protein
MTSLARFTLALLASAVMPAYAGTCRDIVTDGRQIISINAAVNIATHIQLPEPIVENVVGNAADPTSGQGGLWQFYGKGSHYWIKPLDATSKDGERTSITIITASRSYDIDVHRVAVTPDLCVRFADAVPLGGITQAAPTEDAATEAPVLFTHYRWDAKVIESIYDDGRFTYLRLAPRPEGLEVPTLAGGTKKAPELIQADFDPLTRTFKVAGLYPLLRLTDQGKTTSIERVSP